MHELPGDRLEILEQWNDTVLQPSDSMLEAFREIGATPPDLYGNGSDRVLIPCAVKTRSGQEFDPAYISFQRLPPIEMEIPRPKLLSEIAEVGPSKFALSAEMRIATTEAHEQRMGFAPTYIAAPDGTQFCLNWTTDFFIHPQYVARQMQLATQALNLRGEAKFADSDSARIQWFIGDWRDELVRLRLPTRNVQSQLPITLIAVARMG